MPHSFREIANLQDVAQGAKALALIEPRFSEALRQTGPLPLRRRKDGFSALLSAIVSQQISVAAAKAIWGRLEAQGLVTARAVNPASDEALRACGLSLQKIKYARALAGAQINYKALRQMPTDAVIAQLTQVSGIGVWTAEIYAMFALGRQDVFAPGDLALQEATKFLFDLPSRPKEKEMRQIALAWSPQRAVAARALWAYYHVIKDREGIK